MYLAPLNYDRFFKKVFSDLSIAKAFLEDFFEWKIEEIQQLPEKHRVTNEATVVEFDFRCKINGKYVIIDMQQWYKPDVSHRFFMYHSISTALQLENLPLKRIFIDKETKKDIEVKDYRRLEPVITLVWMVDDALGTSESVLVYSMLPEQLKEFIEKKELWEREDIQELLKERSRVLSLANNDTKNLDFIQESKLIFAFQKNIIANEKIKPFVNWFLLADKTRSESNQASDFGSFEKNLAFKEVYLKIKSRICEEELNQDERNYLRTEAENQELAKRGADGFRDEGFKEGKKEGKKEGEKRGLELGRRESDAKVKEAEKQAKLDIALQLLDVLDDATIAKKTGLTISEVSELRNEGYH